MARGPTRLRRWAKAELPGNQRAHVLERVPMRLTASDGARVFVCSAGTERTHHADAAAMLTHETRYRVCYADVDRMGYVYHGHYLRLFEIGRNEMLRALYGSYAQLEDRGYMLPCRSAQIEYLRPAVFDDLLTIRSIVDRVPRLRFTIRAEISNEAGELLTRGQVTLVFADTRTGRPRRAPPDLVARLQEHLARAAATCAGAASAAPGSAAAQQHAAASGREPS